MIHAREVIDVLITWMNENSLQTLVTMVCFLILLYSV